MQRLALALVVALAMLACSSGSNNDASPSPSKTKSPAELLAQHDGSADVESYVVALNQLDPLCANSEQGTADAVLALDAILKGQGRDSTALKAAGALKVFIETSASMRGIPVQEVDCREKAETFR